MQKRTNSFTDNRENGKRALDSGFIKRVYRTSIAVWLFALLWCAVLANGPAAAGITIGFGISLGSFMILERLVKAIFTPDAAEESRRAIKRLLAIAALKYAVIAAILWGVFKLGWVSPVGLAIGIGLPQAVIFLKALGKTLTVGPESGGRQ
ncbi:MAG: ATP synthase subunit I [Armatimonadota bacterium]|nr:ATP synthase subunit I [Armatimonadota bacterium]